jgi:hypothetical protein
MGNGGGAWRQCIPGEWEEGESEGEICPAVHFSFFGSAAASGPGMRPWLAWAYSWHDQFHHVIGGLAIGRTLPCFFFL